MTEEVESCSACICRMIFLVRVLTPSVRPLWWGRMRPAVHGGAVEFEAVAEAVQVGQAGGAGCGDPLGELVVVDLGRGQECGELADESGECGHLRAGRGEEDEQVGVLGPQVLGVGEQEPGEAAGGVTGRSPSARP